jgi:Uma2 family endonuclease
VTAAEKLEPLDWETYLADEERSPSKREYVYGRLFAMAGGSEAHSVISVNCILSIGRRLGEGCRVLNSDFKVRVRDERGVRFYYPDCSVVCDAPMSTAHFRDDPAVVVEVLSPSTRRVDEGEKWQGYLSLPSVLVYLLVDSTRHGVNVWRRQGTQFVPETYAGLHESIALPEIGLTLPLAEIYANVSWPLRAPEPDGEVEA